MHFAILALSFRSQSRLRRAQRSLCEDRIFLEHHTDVAAPVVDLLEQPVVRLAAEAAIVVEELNDRDRRVRRANGWIVWFGDQLGEYLTPLKLMHFCKRFLKHLRV